MYLRIYLVSEHIIGHWQWAIRLTLWMIIAIIVKSSQFEWYASDKPSNNKSTCDISNNSNDTKSSNIHFDISILHMTQLATGPTMINPFSALWIWILRTSSPRFWIMLGYYEVNTLQKDIRDQNCCAMPCPKLYSDSSLLFVVGRKWRI